MMKTSEEIKKGLERCENGAHCDNCLGAYHCQVEADALAYIEQLERERDAAIIELRGYGCEQCAHGDLRNIATICRNCKLGSLWEWQGVKEEKNNG